MNVRKNKEKILRTDIADKGKISRTAAKNGEKILRTDIADKGKISRITAKNGEKISRITAAVAAVLIFGTVFFAAFGGFGLKKGFFKGFDFSDGTSSAIDIGDGSDIGGGVFGEQGEAGYTKSAQGAETSNKVSHDKGDDHGGYRYSYASATRYFYEIENSEQSRDSFDTSGNNNQMRSSAEVYTAYTAMDVYGWAAGYSMSIAYYDIIFSGELLTAMKNGYVSNINFTGWYRSYGEATDHIQTGDWTAKNNPSGTWTARLYNDNTNSTFPGAESDALGENSGSGWDNDADWSFKDVSIGSLASGGSNLSSGVGTLTYGLNGFQTIQNFANGGKAYWRFVVVAFYEADHEVFNLSSAGNIRSQAAIEAVKLDFTYTGTNTPDINFAVNDSNFGEVDANPSTAAIDANTKIGGVAANSTNLNLAPTTANKAVPNAGYYFINWTDNLTPANRGYINQTTLAAYDASKSGLAAPPPMAWFNYTSGANITLTANFAAIPDISVLTFTYSGTAQGPLLADDTGGQYTVVHGYAGTDYGGTAYDSASKPINAGTYTYTATLRRGGETVGVKTYDFSIAKATLSAVYRTDNSVKKIYDGTTFFDWSGLKLRASGSNSDDEYDVLVSGLADADLPADNTNIADTILREKTEAEGNGNPNRLLNEATVGETYIKIYLTLLSANYIFDYTAFEPKVVIVQRQIKVTPKAGAELFSKVYDGDTDADGLTLDELFSLYAAAERYAANGLSFYADDTGLFGYGSANIGFADVFSLSVSEVYNDKDVLDASKLSLFSKLTVKNDNFALILENNALDIPAKITPLDLSVAAEAKSKTYGDSDPLLTYVQSADNIKIGSETAAFSGALTRESGEDADTYAILIGTLALEDDEDDDESGFTASNYRLVFVGDTFLINRRGLTVTPTSGLNKTYGDSDPVLTFTSNALEAEKADVRLDRALTRETGENAGTYNILLGEAALQSNGSFNAANYTLSFTSGVEFTVNRKTVSVSAKTVSGLTKTYDGGMIPAQSASGELGTYLDALGIVGGLGDTVGNIFTITTWEYNSANVADAATIALLVTLNNTNYFVNTNGNTTFSHSYAARVTPLALTVSAKNITVSKTYDGDASVKPEVAASDLENYLDISGYINGGFADISGLLKVVSFAYNGDDGADAGDNKSATLTVKIEDGANYSLPSGGVYSFGGEIYRAAVSVVSGISAVDRVYDGTETVSLSFGTVVFSSNLRQGDDVSINTASAYSARLDDKDSGMGKTVTVSDLGLTGGDADNYILTQPTLFADIYRKTLTVTAENKTVVFDGRAYSPEFSVKDGEIPLATAIDGAGFSAATGIFDETLTFVIEITANGVSAAEAVNAGVYTFKYRLDTDYENYEIDGLTDGAINAVLTVEKASEEAFNEIIESGVSFNGDRKYVYTEGTVIVPRVMAMEIAEKYGITFVSCDVDAISHKGVYPVRFTFLTENFEISHYVVEYTVEARPVEFRIKRETGKITVVDPVPGARFCLLDPKTKKIAVGWQTSPVFDKIDDNKEYIVKMELQGFAADDYAPDKTEIYSAAIKNDLMIWIIVALIIALAFVLWFFATKNKKQPKQGPMGMMPFGPSMPMPGFTAPKLPQAPGLKKFTQNGASAPKNAAQTKANAAQTKTTDKKALKKAESNKAELKKAEAKKAELQKVDLKKAETKKASNKVDLKKDANASAQANGGGQQLVKAAKPIAVKRETVPMLEMKFVRNSAHYGGDAKPEKQTIMRDKMKGE